MLLESARCNITHGDRLSQSDKRRVARDIAADDPECRLSEEIFSQNIGVTRQTVNNWIRDIRARQKAGRDSTIHRLTRLGWSHGKIADVMGISRSRVSEIVGNANFCIIDNLLAQGREMPYIAEHLNMDPATARAIKLAGISDREKFKALGWALRWESDTLKWPCTRKPDLIFFDPPYFTKNWKAYQEKANPRTPSISSLPRHKYVQFFTLLFEPAHENTSPGAVPAFLNAD